MKKLLFILAIASIFFTSCGNKSKDSETKFVVEMLEGHKKTGITYIMSLDTMYQINDTIFAQIPDLLDYKLFVIRRK
jgi:protein involved in sex pheromone biosynthesis